MLSLVRPCHRVLVIEDDNPAQPFRVHAALSDDHAHCECVGWDALTRDDLHRPSLSLIVPVIEPSCPRAPVLFEWLERDAVPARVIAIVPEADEPDLQNVLAFADDFLLAPVRPLELRHRIARLLGGAHQDLSSDHDQLLEQIAMTRLVGRNAAFVDAVRLVPRCARVNATVLVTGETGTGKEVCARAIHHLGARRHAPFVAVDCGALPDQLFENELFGHARGAFTDAHRDQRGLVALADGGTLFLDEIDSLSMTAQAKLLRFLQDQTFRPLGSERIERANVRIIAASNRDLEQLVKTHEFRADLFFRLSILRLHLPPLRDRRDDIPLLAESMLEEFRTADGTSARALSPSAFRTLSAYEWPGNIRELSNVLHRAVLACDGETLQPEHLNLPVPPSAVTQHFRVARAAVVAAFERNYVQDLLRKHGGNVTRAAREAQQDRRAFGRFIKKYNINREAL